MTDADLPEWLPDLSVVYDRVADKVAKETTSARRSLPPSQRIKQAIAELGASGAPVNSRASLLRFILTATAAVQRGEPGFRLSRKDSAPRPESIDSSEREPADDRADDEPIRVFYGGSVTDPRDPANTKSEIKSRRIAEQIAADCSAEGTQMVTLEQLGDAAIIDRLDLWDGDLGDEVAEEISAVLDEFPDWAARVNIDNGEAPIANFARIAWTEGLSAQYGREAGQEGLVVNPAPFEGQTWIQNERPAVFANGHADPEKYYNLGFTHEPLSITDGGLGKRSQPLPEYTGPMTEAQAMKFIESSIAEQRTRPRKPGKLTNPPIPSTHGALNPITADELTDHVKTTQANTKRAAKHPPVDTTPDQSQTTTRKPHQHPENNDPKPETHSPRQ